MKRIFFCNWFFIAKCIGHYGLDFVLVNVLLAGWPAAGCLLLLPSFSFSSHFLSFPFISSQISPKTVGPLYLLPPLLIIWGSELTLFTIPLLITSLHYAVFSKGYGMMSETMTAVLRLECLGYRPASDLPLQVVGRPQCCPVIWGMICVWSSDMYKMFSIFWLYLTRADSPIFDYDWLRLNCPQ